MQEKLNVTYTLAKPGFLDITLTEASPALQALVETVSEVCVVPVAMITLLDTERQWHKARTGIEITSIPICDSFCRYAISEDVVMEIPDARYDSRFVSNPLVTGPIGVRAYAGAPIELSSGDRIGALCAIDDAPRVWKEADLRLLRNLAVCAASLLELEASEKRIAQMTETLSQNAERARQFDMFLNELQEGVVVQDRDSNILEANPSAAELLGLSLGQLLGRDSFDPGWKLVDPSGTPIPPELQPSNQAIRTGKPVTGYILGVELPDQRTRWLSVNSQPYVAEGAETPDRTATTFIDITEKRERELELVRQSETLAIAVRKAEAANAAKTAFLANVSHELRTPLNGIVGIASILDRTQLTDEQAEMISLIRTSGHALGKLIDDTLDLSRIEADHLEISSEPFRLKDAVQAATDLFRVSATEKGLDYQIQMTGCNTTVTGDAIRLRQIISNLVANAIKFTNQGYVRVRVHLRPTGERSGVCRLSVLVADTGIGFSSDQKARLFTRFQQGDKSITRRYGGVGLGLSISEALATAMGGNISARSTPGKGSVFCLSLPLLSGETVVEDPGRDPLPALSETGSIRVLVAEDHPINQRMLSIILDAAGCKTTLVANGRDAVREFRTQGFDCLILDMHMPEMDGLSAAKEIRNLPGGAEVPIIMLTADTSGQGLGLAETATIDTILYKPVTADGLLAAMQTTIEAAGRADGAAVQAISMTADLGNGRET